MCRCSMTAILGISALYHDSAAALVVDGQIVAAAQEERFSRKKHDQQLPVQAIDYCLQHAGLEPGQIDYVGFYDKPMLKFERLLETFLAYAPRGFRAFRRVAPVWLKEKLHVPRLLNQHLGGKYRRRFVFCEHHESHASSGFFPSPFDEAAILTLDGVGEWATATCGYGRGNRIELSHELRFPHSLGLLYSAFTYYCGFKVNSGEYKLMGLAPYGEPVHAETILNRLVDLKADGSFRLDLSYFNYCHGSTMTSARFHELFGGPPRTPESPLTQRHMDLAASIQSVTEEIVLRAARHIHALTGSKNLCLAGGVALNCVANGRVLREGPFESLWIQPAAGDAGGALGVALLIWHQLLDQPRRPEPMDAQSGSLLGPSFTEDEIIVALESCGAKFHHYRSDDDLCKSVVELLAEEKVVGWFSGRMEFGPRALGSRSILGDPRSPRMQMLINTKIKLRESFRPFAPSVLHERTQEFFETSDGLESPYMLLTARVRDDKRVIPAVTHVDHSARLQTVDSQRHGRYYQLLSAFEALTGCPVLVNTSFNVRGEPIVCTPQEAYRCFMATDMDALVLERFVLLKQEQPTAASREANAYVAQFELD